MDLPPRRSSDAVFSVCLFCRGEREEEVTRTGLKLALRAPNFFSFSFSLSLSFFPSPSFSLSRSWSCSGLDSTAAAMPRKLPPLPPPLAAAEEEEEEEEGSCSAPVLVEVRSFVRRRAERGEVGTPPLRGFSCD